MNEKLRYAGIVQAVAQAKPREPEPDQRAGLKLQILKAARQQQQKRLARMQLGLVTVLCLLTFFVTEWQLQSLGKNENSLLRMPTVWKERSALTLASLELETAHIGTWLHVEAVTKCKFQVHQLLATM